MLRITLSNTRFSPVVVTVVFYVLVSVFLFVSYLVCAISIRSRIENMGSGKAKRLNKMTTRFALSAIGYITTIILEIVTAALSSQNAWATQILFNLVFASLNWTAMLQIIGLKPFSKSAAGNTHSIQTNTGPFSDFPERSMVDSSIALQTVP